MKRIFHYWLDMEMEWTKGLTVRLWQQIQLSNQTKLNNFVKINTGNLNSYRTINLTITLTIICNVPYSKFYCSGKIYSIKIPFKSVSLTTKTILNLETAWKWDILELYRKQFSIKTTTLLQPIITVSWVITQDWKSEWNK